MTTTNEGGAVVFEALTEEEENLRRRLEDRIEKRLGGIFDDLMEIQRRKLWRSTHGSFENYCRTRWNFGKSRGYQIAAAGQVMTLLLEAGETVVPQNERQARELIASGLQPEDQAVLWKFVKETAPNGKISSSHIKSVVGYVREMIVTGGAVDDGSGEMSHISEVVKAGITEDVYERFQRQLAHLNGGANGRKRTYLETREVRSNDAAWVMFQVDKPDSDYIVKLFEEGEDEGEDKVFILAAGHQQYLDACRKLKLGLRQAVYVDNETKLAGVANITVHFQDGWWLHPKHREIYDALQVVGYQKLEAK